MARETSVNDPLHVDDTIAQALKMTAGTSANANNSDDLSKELVQSAQVVDLWIS